MQEILGLLNAIKSEFAAHGRVHRTQAGEIVRIFSSHDFSDLVVRCTEIPAGASVGDYIDSELFHLGYKQVFLVIEGVLIRGGMFIGEMLVADEGIVFGPGLVKAYDLESKYAVYLRIVIDRDLINDAEQQGYIGPLRDWVRRGEDGAYYLDYLFGSSVMGFVVPDSPSPQDLLHRHRRTIEVRCCFRCFLARSLCRSVLLSILLVILLAIRRVGRRLLASRLQVEGFRSGVGR